LGYSAHLNVDLEILQLLVYFVVYMSAEGERNKTSHQIVTRPYSPERYSDSDGRPLVSKPLIEVDIKKADILDQMENFVLDKKTTPATLTEDVMNFYREKFGTSQIKPDIFFHIIQMENLEKLAPKLQVYVSDMVLGNLNRDGLYRTVFDSQNSDIKKTKKYIGDVLRLYWAGVINIKGVYFGYRVDPKNKENNL